MLSRRVKKKVKRRSTRRRKQRGGSAKGGTAIIIEPRKVPALEFVVKNVLENLGSHWKLIIFPGSENKAHVKDLIEQLPAQQKSRASICDIGLETMTEAAYNKLMMSKRILDKIPTEMFLVIQADSLICKQGAHLLDKFMSYDYVGAPWKGRNALGNGGFSLRRKSKMLEILATCPTLNHNEDGFFSGGCKGAVPKKPTPEQAKEFSIETINSPQSFGIHKAWQHFPNEVDAHNSQCLGYSELKRLNTGHKGGTKPLKLGVMAIFKNESMILKEWIEHYKWQGADAIVLLNNDSTDDWKSITDQFEGLVVAKDVPGKHVQLKAYNETGLPIMKEKGIDVLLVADIDEYYFGRDGRLIKDYVKDVFSAPSETKVSGFTCGWSMFGSNGHETQPASVREGFTKRWHDKAEPENGISGKSTFLLSDLSGGKISSQHIPDVTGKLLPCPQGLQVNHYPIMSKEYYNKVKKVRGDVFTANHNSARDDDYFTRYDKNVVEDTLLADQVKKFRENPPTG